MVSCHLFIHVLQGYFIGTEGIMWLPVQKSPLKRSDNFMLYLYNRNPYTPYLARWSSYWNGPPNVWLTHKTADPSKIACRPYAAYGWHLRYPACCSVDDTADGSVPDGTQATHWSGRFQVPSTWCGPCCRGNIQLTLFWKKKPSKSLIT